MAFSQDNDVILIKLEGIGNPTVYAPIASETVKGIASFEDGEFVVDGGHVQLGNDVVKTVNGKGPDENGDVYVDTLRDLKLYDALLLTDHNGEPLEDQDGRYIAPPEVDEYARASIETLEETVNELRLLVLQLS